MTDKEIFEHLTKDAPPFDPDKCEKLYLGINMHLTVGVIHTANNKFEVCQEKCGRLQSVTGENNKE